jgi:antitoxin component YwqK of YwqJK toxin-antitoxin module
MIVYGTGEVKHRSSHTAIIKSKCPECGEPEVTFHFFKKYFHLFWIPVFPYQSRQLAFCEKCHAGYQESIPSSLHSDLERARSYASFPWQAFSGLVILAVVISSITYFSDGKTTHYYPSKKKQSEGKYLNEKPDGKWTYWFENGKIEAECNFVNGLEEGQWSWYNEKGIKIKSGGYHNGRYHGKWMFYSERGDLLEEYIFTDNRKQGPSTTFYESGIKSSEGNYERDLPQGKWTFWYENKNKMTEGEFAAGEKSGIWKTYFDDGNLKSETDFKGSTAYTISLLDKKGKQLVKNGNGSFSDYYEGGQKSTEGSVKNGLPDGPWSWWYKDGKLKDQGIYQEGNYKLLTGFDPEGQIMVRNGNGYYKSYYENGVIESESNYQNGKPEGLKVTRNESGTVLEEANYHHGKYDGEFKGYNETGELYTQGIFKNDSQEGVWTWFHLNGKKEAEVTFVNGMKEGEEIFWSETGDIVKREHYKNGELTSEEAN